MCAGSRAEVPPDFQAALDATYAIVYNGDYIDDNGR
jgi:hypothetical protein